MSWPFDILYNVNIVLRWLRSLKRIVGKIYNLKPLSGNWGHVVFRSFATEIAGTSIRGCMKTLR